MTERSRVSYSHEMRDEAREKQHALLTIDVDQESCPEAKTRVTIQMVLSPERAKTLQDYCLAQAPKESMDEALRELVGLTGDGATA